VADIRIGISGWRYPPWRGAFYPPRWPQARELEYASRRVGSIEINGSFDAMALAHRLKLGPRPAPPPDLASVREAPRTRWPGFGRGRDQAAVPRRRSQPSRTE
jgi:hypothetical protein